MAGLDDATRSKLLALAGGLRTGAAHELGSLGTQNLGLAQQGTMDQANLSQTQLNNFMNSILGKGTSNGLGFENLTRSFSKWLQGGNPDEVNTNSSGADWDWGDKWDR